MSRLEGDKQPAQKKDSTILGMRAVLLHISPIFLTAICSMRHSEQSINVWALGYPSHIRAIC